MPSLSAQTAQEIVRRTMAIIPFNINVMDIKGVILGSGDAKRVGEIHPIVQEVVRQAKGIEVTESLAKSMAHTKAGVNLPLRVAGEICGVIGITGAPQSVRKYAELVRSGAEMMLEQEKLLFELQGTKQYQEEFAFHLIFPTNASAHEKEAWAKRLGYHFEEKHSVILLHLREARATHPSHFADLKSLQERLYEAEPSVLQALLSPKEWAIICPISPHLPEEEALALWLARLQAIILPFATPFFLSAGIALLGMHEITRSYQTAKAALQFGQKHKTEARVFSYYDMRLPVLFESVNAGWQKEELRKPWEALLAFESSQAHFGSALLHTIKTWFACQEEGAKTAKMLGIHRNTLDYRLQKIKEITGLDLKKTEDRFLLYLSVHLEG